MVAVYKCPKCNGLGCDFCGNSGFFAEKEGSGVQIKLTTFFKEPSDFIWAIKNIKNK
jgi:hypothetical protein